MGLSLEERKRKLIEEVCASCSGGGGTEVGAAPAESEGGTGDPTELAKALAMLRKKRGKKVKEDGA